LFQIKRAFFLKKRDWNRNRRRRPFSFWNPQPLAVALQIPMNEQGLHRREYHRPPPWPFSQPIIGAGRIMRPPPPPVHHCYCYSITKILQGSTPAATDEQLSTRTRPNRTKLNLGRHIGMWNETNEPLLLTDEPLCVCVRACVCVCDGDASGDLTRPKLGGVSADQGKKKAFGTKVRTPEVREGGCSVDVCEPPAGERNEEASASCGGTGTHTASDRATTKSPTPSSLLTP